MDRPRGVWGRRTEETHMVQVLVVDDDPGIREMLHSIFEMEGIGSVGISLGKDAVRVAASVQPRSTH